MLKTILFESVHQSEIDEMVNEIALEFDASIFHKPTNEIPSTHAKYWVVLNNNKVIGTVGLICINNKFGILKRMMLKKNRGKELGISKLFLEKVVN